MDQFKYNLSVMTEEDQRKLKNIKVGIIGLGGLGGFVVSSLARLGVEHFVLFEYDVYEESNLNRQLYSTQNTLGKSKLDTTAKSLIEINSNIQIEQHQTRFDENSHMMVDVLFDCLDNIIDRLLLEDLALKLEVPLIHGAVAGWYGQIAITSGKPFLRNWYKDARSSSVTSPTFTVPIVGNIMVTEFLKHLQGDISLVNHMMLIDLLERTIDVI